MTITTAAEAITALEKWRRKNSGSYYSVRATKTDSLARAEMTKKWGPFVVIYGRSFREALIKLARKAQGE